MYVEFSFHSKCTDFLVFRLFHFSVPDETLLYVSLKISGLIVFNYNFKIYYFEGHNYLRKTSLPSLSLAIGYF